MIKVIEAFSGIGSQSQALKNIEIDYKVEAIIEWEISAMIAYDVLHNGPQDLSRVRVHNRESLIETLSKYNLSNDGKEPITKRSLSIMSTELLRSILAAILRNKNLVDISQVSGESIPECDLLTYSFPCQDLSISGYWHNNTSGIDRDAKNRSSLLWQIERILIELTNSNSPLPRFLLMENVNNILSKKHSKNFDEWKAFLNGIGYMNMVYTLDARNFGIPQSRKRTFMLSVRVDSEYEKAYLTEYFEKNNLEDIKLPTHEIKKLSSFLKMDYKNNKYRMEALANTPNLTESRQKIARENPVLAKGNVVYDDKVARTITTKQDRNPNSGIIIYDEPISDKNKLYRNLTPRECFLLMGFSEKQFDTILENNIKLRGNKKLFTNAKLIKLAGNSIVVPILEAIFSQMNDIHQLLENKKDVKEH